MSAWKYLQSSSFSYNLSKHMTLNQPLSHTGSHQWRPVKPISISVQHDPHTKNDQGQSEMVTSRKSAQFTVGSFSPLLKTVTCTHIKTKFTQRHNSLQLVASLLC